MKNLKSFDEFILEANGQEAYTKKELIRIKKMFQDKNAPIDVILNFIKIYAKMKLQWNKKEINLDKIDINNIIEVQKLTQKYYPEYEYYFTQMKKQEIQDELLKHLS